MRGDRRQPYGIPHSARKRRRRLRPADFPRAVLCALQSVFARLLGFFAAVFSAASALRRKDTAARTQIAAAPDAPSFFAAADAVPAYNPRHGLRVMDILLVSGVALSALFLLWALHYSDTSVPVMLTARGYTRTVLTKARTADELLQNMGVTLRAGDAVTCDTGADDIAAAAGAGDHMDAALADGARVTVDSAFPVAVSADGKFTVYRLRGGTVKDTLALAGVTYDADDELSELPFADVAPGMVIRRVDVQTYLETSEYAIEYSEEVVKDPKLYTISGYSHVKTRGENGLKRVTYKYILKDGELAAREVVEQTILKEAVDEVRVVGVTQTPFTGDTRAFKDRPKESDIAKTIVADEVTAYTHTGGRTATGRHPRIGYVAVNPSVIPYGTRLYIPGYGYCTAQDTGAFRHEEDGGKNQIDVFLNTEKECIRWGRKYNVTIYILK
jgi:3D (Asp-Asp-Asp) domain-containing protein/uncharacterized protein YabE (DUF348 family)